MSWYNSAKEIYSDIKNDKTMMILLRVFGGVLIILTIIITYKAIFEPVNIWGLELNGNKVKHDTLRTVIHDTIYLTKTKPHESVTRTHMVKGNVTSIDQKGGQTANQINNNY